MTSLLQRFSTMTNAFVLATALLLGYTNGAIANEHEAQCFSNIQGKIAWDDAGNVNWDAENVKHLCAGTSKPEEPGKCFSAVNSEHAKGAVNWGKGTEWEWRNIINLCSGSNDAEKTVTCFKNGIKAGTDWRQVILFCQRAM
ncbi:MAG: hypothetical protein ACKN9T_16830 [Candidatus Methylumidiphilus sp.]